MFTGGRPPAAGATGVCTAQHVIMWIDQQPVGSEWHHTHTYISNRNAVYVRYVRMQGQARGNTSVASTDHTSMYCSLGYAGTASALLFSERIVFSFTTN